MIESIDVRTAAAVGPTENGNALGFGAFIKRGDDVILSEGILIEPRPENTYGVASYAAVNQALAFLCAKGLQRHQVRFYTDNVNLVRKINGIWTFKEKNGMEFELHEIARAFTHQFPDLHFSFTTYRDNAAALELALQSLRKAGFKPLEPEKKELSK